MDALITQARKVPSDKLEWKPMEEGRSALDQVQECAVIAGFYPGLFVSKALPDFTPEMMQQFAEAKAQLSTLEIAEAELRKNTAATVSAIRDITDEELDTEMKFFGPEPWKFSGVLNAHCWNMHYHTGQICYIQTLLGDKSM